MRRFQEEDRPYHKCYDCGLEYDKFPCDMIIQDDLWELINPTLNRGCGILCPNCICARLMQLPGMCSVNVIVDVAASCIGKAATQNRVVKLY